MLTVRYRTVKALTLYLWSNLLTRVIYKILKQIKDSKNTNDRRKINVKKSVGNATLIASVADAVEADCLSPWHICWHNFCHPSR
jgi:hypothetical protein